MPSLDANTILHVLAKLNTRDALKRHARADRDNAYRNLRAMLKLSAGQLRHEIQETIYREHRRTLRIRTNATDPIQHTAKVRKIDVRSVVGTDTAGDSLPNTWPCSSAG